MTTTAPRPVSSMLYTSDSNPSGAHGITPWSTWYHLTEHMELPHGFSGNIRLFVLYLLVSVLSVRLWIAVSDFPLVIFKYFLLITYMAYSYFYPPPLDNSNTRLIRHKMIGLSRSTNKFRLYEIGNVNQLTHLALHCGN